jgi:single-stranded DNA-specific DHH superfamily exonuclease
MPQVYRLNFTEEDQIASGVEAVRLATQNFFGKLLTGQLASLGFSLFFFSLSVITSAAAVLMTLRYAQRDDVQMSWNEEVKEQRDRWLDQMWQELVAKEIREREI